MKKVIGLVVLMSTSAFAGDAKEIFNSLNVQPRMKPMRELTEYVTFVKSVGGLTCNQVVYHNQTAEDFEKAKYSCSLEF